MPEDFDPSQFGGQIPEGFDPSQFGGQFPDENEQTDGDDEQTVQGDTSSDSAKAPFDKQENTAEGSKPNRGNMSEFGNMPGSVSGEKNNNGTLLLYGACSIVMLVAFLFVLFYRRKPRKR